jgi:hypothetical protein
MTALARRATVLLIAAGSIAALGGCAQSTPFATSQAAIDWCNRNSPDASLCAGFAPQDHATCSAYQGEGYDRCRSEIDRFHFRNSPRLHDSD